MWSAIWNQGTESILFTRVKITKLFQNRKRSDHKLWKGKECFWDYKKEILSLKNNAMPCLGIPCLTHNQVNISGTRVGSASIGFRYPHYLLHPRYLTCLSHNSEQTERSQYKCFDFHASVKKSLYTGSKNPVLNIINTLTTGLQIYHTWKLAENQQFSVA